MQNRDDGGPAFPVRKEPLDRVELGMSLRDYFAAAALGTLMRGAWVNRSDMALECYKVADAMLAERKK